MNTCKNEEPPRPVHQIRLSSQWDLRLRINDGTQPSKDPTPLRLKSVADCQHAMGTDDQGTIQLKRSFGRPSGLAPNDRVVLVIDASPPGTRVSLNDQILPTAAEDTEQNIRDSSILLRYDVSRLLRDRNQLMIELESPGAKSDNRPIHDVRLEIFA